MPSVKALLTGMLVLALALAAWAGTTVQAADEEPPSFSAQSTDGGSSDFEQVVAITYPTAEGTTYRNDYDGGRGGNTRTHRATDIMGTMGEKVYAARAGEIVWMPGQDPADMHPTAGYGMQIRGSDGRMYAYYHLGTASEGPSGALAEGLRKGDTVTRGQHIGYLGDSGNAAGGSPHLHFEIHDDRVTDPYGTNRINPYFSLQDAERRGDYPTGGAGEEPPVDSAPVDRVAGRDRVRTAIELSQTAFTSADHVVLADGDSFADSLAAGPLAAQLDGPVLATRGAALEQIVIDELDRLGATHVTIAGGDGAVPMQVQHDLVERAGLDESGVRRLAGPNRFATAAKIARAVWAAGGTRRAGVALGRHAEEHRAWPDALSAGYHGAVTGAPVLLVTSQKVPAVTAAALEDVAEATVVGGSAAVSDEVYATIETHAGAVRRLSGPDRYMTSAAVAADLLDQGVSAQRIWAATGHNFADALAAAPAVAHHGEVLLLIDGLDTGKDSRLGPWLSDRADHIESGLVVGGTAAISDAALERFGERLAG